MPESCDLGEVSRNAFALRSEPLAILTEKWKHHMNAPEKARGLLEPVLYLAIKGERQEIG